MPSAYSKESDHELAARIAEENCILRAVVGSTVHGLSNPGTDDRDEMGVCVEPREYVLGLRSFEHWIYRTQDEGKSSGPGDLDLTVYSLRKFCRLAVKGSPTVLLLLFINDEHLLVRDELGQQLQDLAPAFVSKRAGRAFLGYLDGQKRSLLGERTGARARERSELHGYDTKYAMHALRIAHQGTELMTTGRMTLPVAEPARSELRAVRNGQPELRDVLADLAARTEVLEKAVASSDVPAEPDTDAVNRFLVNAHESIWAKMG